jgi:hypothetical protein
LRPAKQSWPNVARSFILFGGYQLILWDKSRTKL